MARRKVSAKEKVNFLLWTGAVLFGVCLLLFPLWNPILFNIRGEGAFYSVLLNLTLGLTFCLLLVLFFVVNRFQNFYKEDSPFPSILRNYMLALGITLIVFYFSSLIRPLNESRYLVSLVLVTSLSLTTRRSFKRKKTKKIK